MKTIGIVIPAHGDFAVAELCGVNLPMLLEALTGRDEVSLPAHR